MKRYLKIFWLLSSYSIKTSFQHRLGVVSFLLGKIIRFTVYFFFIYFLVSRTKLLAGYNLNQTIIFFLVYNIIDSLTQMFFREVYRFRPLVVSGELDHILLKPYHPFLRILVGGIDPLDIIMLVPYLIILVFFILQAGMAILPVNFFIFLILMSNALILATFFHILVLAIGIFTTEVDHTILIYRDFARMASLPTDIYSEPLRFFITFVIPVGLMMTIPAKALFGLLTINILIISAAITVFFGWFSLSLWNNALKKYQSWGG
ncbi:MAG: hypothetical protein US11_C0004G0047 [Candidatus Roizmanbacteria bacterium GW2011_GWA2_36_23]|uniref:Uncharacterized protein n=1 Tax=Candidatus Roizmanbacteria bacterium GW2011_GWA2_36_23 TaxID=1618480 RepID=A0A0G0E8C0_9BACT|nr:MAG: hypothetical protein US11_C0004G0047 [Candidatus Roizmanbacteria bacterium GW2011_GWA2_36_23]